MAVAFFKCILIQCLIISIRKVFPVHPLSSLTIAESDFYFVKTCYDPNRLYLKSISAEFLQTSITNQVTYF